MTCQEIRLRQMSAQHLLAPTDAQTAVRDLCGVQAQFLSHALHALAIRSPRPDTSQMVKSWTIRGTMHLFAAEDLPLFLHQGRSHYLRDVDTMWPDAFASAERKAYFARHILDAVAAGTEEREALKAVCAAAGMTEQEERSLFDPWGGLIRALCEQGLLCHKVQEKKAFQLCPAFEPMEEEAARLELARRYFTHFGPATIKDAAYFFGTTQSGIRPLLSRLPVRDTDCDGRTYFSIDSGAPAAEDIPRCLFLAGFDQLLLGYEKKESLYLPQEHLRDIFTLAGIVRPALLVDGRVVGWWKRKDRRLKITLFSPADRALVSAAAEAQWSELKQIEFE